MIAPKKDSARAKASLTHKLTAQLNRRAESALITRMGGNREGSLKLVRPDAQIVEEIKAKKNKKEVGRNNSNDNQKALEKVGDSINSLSKSALDHLNEDFEGQIDEYFSSDDSE